VGVYDRFLLPRLIDCACGVKLIGQQRALLVPGAEGRVLEVGAGSGLNFRFYDQQRVRELIALEPSAELRRMAALAAVGDSLPVTFLNASAEAIPLETDSVDTVVITYTLCSIANAEQGLAEIRRVLKTNGRLLFAEHGRAPEPSVQRWQDRLTPLWKHAAGGCHLNRDIPGLIAAGGFEVRTLDARYLTRPKVFAFNYRGEAVAR
jgi:ubiquinone/menaquinone biosynthesis C-methylase UbiE